MAAEAIEQHGVPTDRVTVVGAAIFDRFFAELQQIPPARSMRPGWSSTSAPRPRLLRTSRGSPAAGSPRSDRTTIRSSATYGSSCARTPRSRAGGAGSRRTTGRLLEPYVKSDRHSLAHLLRTTTAVVALNTSAELEAAISGVPVLTFRAGADAPGQEGSAQFEYLLEQRGGFVLDAGTARGAPRRARACAPGRVRPRDDRRIRAAVRPSERGRPAGHADRGRRDPANRADAAQSRGGARTPRPHAATERTDGRPRILSSRPPRPSRRLPASSIRSSTQARSSSSPARLEPVLRQPGGVRAASAHAPGSERTRLAIIRATGEVLRLLRADDTTASPALVAAVQRLLEFAGHPDVHELGRSPQLRIEPKAHERLTAALDAIEWLPPPPGARERALRTRRRLDASRQQRRTGSFDLDVLKAAGGRSACRRRCSSQLGQPSGRDGPRRASRSPDRPGRGAGRRGRRGRFAGRITARRGRARAGGRPRPGHGLACGSALRQQALPALRLVGAGEALRTGPRARAARAGPLRERQGAEDVARPAGRVQRPLPLAPIGRTRGGGVAFASRARQRPLPRARLPRRRRGKELAFTRLARALSVDPDSVNAYAHSPVLERISEGSHLNEVFAELERLIPPDEGLRSFIAGLELDLVVSINRVNVGGPQMEPVKCAAALGLPVAVVVYSWDNLPPAACPRSPRPALRVERDAGARGGRGCTASPPSARSSPAPPVSTRCSNGGRRHREPRWRWSSASTQTRDRSSGSDRRSSSLRMSPGWSKSGGRLADEQ